MVTLSMSLRPPAPYPDGTPDYWAKEILAHRERAAGKTSYVSNGDFSFHSDRWQTVHGSAMVVRSDAGAFMVWGAQLPDGRRVHCRKRPGSPDGVWRRRSDNGRSWVVGKIKFKPDEVYFTDGLASRPPVELNANAFELAMADQASFIRELQDDSFAFTLNRDLWNGPLCTVDGNIGWHPSNGEAADTIARLQNFGETWADFKSGGPYPEPPRTDPGIIITALAAAGWRYATEADWRRLFPESFR